MSTSKLVILGRDGTINVFRGDHVKSPDEWTPIDGVLEAIARMHHAGWHLVVARNQSGIGRGMYDMASLNAVHAKMMSMIAAAGGRIDAVFFCPHAPNEPCDCRKPLPGLLLEIGERYGARMSDVIAVGDSLKDLQAAAAAGCEPHLLRTGRAAALGDDELAQWLAQVPATHVHADLAAFAEMLVQRADAIGAYADPARRA